MLKQSLILLLGCGVGFGVHYGVLSWLGLNPLEHHIVMSYTANTLLALLLLILLFKASDTLKPSLGFLFMGGSFLKFGLFFLVFYPLYKEDGDVSKREFFTFFIPYATALIFETKALINKVSKD